MKSKDLFKLAVQILGLVFLYRGLSALPTVIELVLMGSFVHSAVAVLGIAWPLVVAWWLLGGAPLLMRRAYPDSSRDEGEPGSCPAKS